MYESRLLASQQSYDSLEDSYRVLAGEVEKLKSERREYVEHFEKLKEQRETDTASWRSERSELKQEVTALRREKSSLEEESEERSQESARERSEWQRSEVALRSANNQLQGQVRETEARFTTESARHRADTEQLEAERVRVKELEAALQKSQAERASAKSADEEEAVTQQLHSILTTCRRLEGEVATLRSSNTTLRKQAEGAAVLREENHGLQRKVETLQELQDKIAQLQQDNDRRDQELEQWDQVLSSTGTSSHGSKIEAGAAIALSDLENEVPLQVPALPVPLQRSNLPTYLFELRGTISGLLTRTRILTDKVQNSQRQSDDMQAELRSATEETERLVQRQKELQSSEAEWRRAKDQAEDEMRRYRELLKTYEQQEQQQKSFSSLNAPATVVKTEASEAAAAEDSEMGDSGNDDGNNVKPAAHHLERIALLEGELSLRSNEVTRIEREGESAREGLKGELASALSDADALRNDLLELQRENERLDQALGRAEERLGLGEFDNDKYRCLVLKRNPVDLDRDLRTSTMDRLKGENEELVKRIEELSGKLTSMQRQQQAATATSDASTNPSAEGERDGDALVPSSVLSNLRTEIATLQDSLKQKDKVLLRLKQVYTLKAGEFRSAIQSLFGFKVKFLENGQVKLNSTFARSSRATSLVFQSDQDDVGRMKLAGEAVNDSSLANIPHLREYWLGAGGMRRSVPCFLAALQLELYESTTQAVRGAWSVPDAEDEE